MKRKLLLSITAVMLVVSMVVAGCAGPAGPPGPAGPAGPAGPPGPAVAPAPAPTPTPAPAPTPTPAPAPKPEGSATLAGARLGAYADPYSASSAKHSMTFISLYDGLIQPDLEGSPEPRLAESWTVEEDGITFQLRQGVKFHNGDEFTADDVVYTWELLSKEETISPAKGPLVATIDRFEVKGPYEVKAYAIKPFGVLLLPSLLWTYNFPIMPKDYRQRVGDDAFRYQPVGTGPFKFVEGDLRDYIILEANENYFDPDKVPHVKTLEIQNISEAGTRIARLLAGEADYIDRIITTQAQELAKTEGIEMISWLKGTMGAVSLSNLNPDSPWVKSKEVRLALSLAINREDMNQALYLGKAAITGSQIQPRAIGYLPGLKPRSYDPEKAKQLLAEAGYPDGFVADGPLVTYASLPAVEEHLAMVGAYWRAIGVEVKMKPMEAGLLYEMLEKGRPNFGYIYFAGARESAVHYLDTMVNPACEDTLWYEDKLIRWLEETRDARSTEEYIQMGHKILQYLYDEVIFIALYEPPEICLMNSNKIKSPLPHVTRQRTPFFPWTLELN